MSYFAHRLQKDKEFFKTYHNKYSKEFINNYEELSKNDWELHKKYIKEGHNPNEIAKIIRKDEIEKFQEMSSQTNFDFNQIIEPSLYERCDFVNKENVSLIDYAAFFGSVKCFKYLLMNGANVENTGKYAVAGGNEEIIHLCEQNHSSFQNVYDTAIEFHRNDIFHYLYENKIEEITHLEKIGESCIMHHDYEVFSFLIGEGMEVNNDIINTAAVYENIFLVKHFLKENQPPIDILLRACESDNIELIKYILKKGIDINIKNVNFFCLIFILIN